jgi:pseudouridine-5'-phosphate glycosidase
VRQQGAVPATIAILGGKIRVGLTDPQLEHLAVGTGIRKVSRRDLPIVVGLGGDGATTVAATSTIAAWAGVDVFATGGIGGVHRGDKWDISNDLPTLAATPTVVVCSGAKSILNLRATLEWLETAGVPVIGYGCDEFPAFYARSSGLPVDVRVDSPAEVAAILKAGREIGLPGGLLVAVPVPPGTELPAEGLDEAVRDAMAEARAAGIVGSATTPFLLQRVAKKTAGESLEANVALLVNNAAIAAQIAVAVQQHKKA